MTDSSTSETTQSDTIHFVWLGDHESSRPLIHALADHDGCVLVGAVAIGELHNDIVSQHPSARIFDNWQDLLSLKPQAIIVAGSSDAVLDGARQLTTEGVTPVVFPLVASQSVFAYELSIIRDDTGVPLLPVLPAHSDAALRELRKSIRNADTNGRPLAIRMQRTIPAKALLQLHDIDQSLLIDSDVLRYLGGNYDQVTAIHTGRTDDGVTNATVNLAGTDVPEATWNLVPDAAAAESTWTIDVTFENGQTRLSGGSFFSPAKQDGVTDSVPADGLAKDTLRDIVTALNSSNTLATASATWTDLTRAFEIVDVSHDSLRRRRTLDLHFETTSERSLFKTKMTAIGCGLLTWTLFGLVMFLIVGNLLGPTSEASDAANAGSEPPVESGWYWVWVVLRILWILPLVVFMLLQILVVLTRPARPAGEDSALKDDSAINGEAS